MSILVDDREDPALVRALEQFGLPLSVCRLDFGDIAIQSCDGRLIGFERKRLMDLIACMKDRRLSGRQLKGMYGLYNRVELIIEAVWRPGAGGAIEIPNGRAGAWVPLYHLREGISYRQVDSYLYSLEECGGVYVWRTGSLAETAHLVSSRWHWWNDKPYHLHKAHDVLFSNQPAAQRRGAVTLHQGEPNAVTLLAAQIPGLDATAWDVGKWFASPYEMIAADVAEWRRIEWTDRSGNVKHFGRDRAAGIVAWLRGLKV